MNLAANVAWRRDVLQFVPGLGPRKAQALLQVRPACAAGPMAACVMPLLYLHPFLACPLCLARRCFVG